MKNSKKNCDQPWKFKKKIKRDQSDIRTQYPTDHNWQHTEYYDFTFKLHKYVPRLVNKIFERYLTKSNQETTKTL